MKIRKCFVANSSSSSFVCHVCGEQTEAYMDACLSDFEMSCCVNGHNMCNEHLLDELTESEEEETDGSCYDLPERVCPICQFQVLSQPDAVEYLLESRGIPKEVVFAKVKEMNKRRKKLYDYEYIQHVSSHLGLTEAIILDEIKSKYATYSDFMNRNNTEE